MSLDNNPLLSLLKYFFNPEFQINFKNLILGYVKDSHHAANRCVADCPGGCPNGQCSAPNFCICNPGYVKESKGSQNCIRRIRRSAMHYDLIPQEMFKH